MGDRRVLHHSEKTVASLRPERPPRRWRCPIKGRAPGTSGIPFILGKLLRYDSRYIEINIIFDPLWF